MIIVHGSIEIAPDNREDAMRLSLEHVTRSRTEPGCISHAVHVDAENTNRLMFFEEWADMDALQTHFQVAETMDFLKQIQAIGTTDPSLRMFEASEVG